MKGYRFSVEMTVRVNDLNYGGHVGYQHYFSYFQEARVAYLAQWGYSEMDIEGCGIIVGEANCKYKRELYAGDLIQVACAITSLRSKSFTMKYRISRKRGTCATGFTQNFCFDYGAKKVIRPPEPFVHSITAYENL